MCTRINSTAALSRVAQDFPAALEPHTDLLIELLKDDHHLVRENACWVLGHIEAEEAREGLRSARDDGQESVRTRARWALARLEEVSSE